MIGQTVSVFKDDYLNDLPDELLTHIFHFLPSKTLFSIERVCRNIFRVLEDDNFWYKRVKIELNKKIELVDPKEYLKTQHIIFSHLKHLRQQQQHGLPIQVGGMYINMGGGCICEWPTRDMHYWETLTWTTYVNVIDFNKTELTKHKLEMNGHRHIICDAFLSSITVTDVSTMNTAGYSIDLSCDAKIRKVWERTNTYYMNPRCESSKLAVLFHRDSFKLEFINHQNGRTIKTIDMSTILLDGLPLSEKTATSTVKGFSKRFFLADYFYHLFALDIKEDRHYIMEKGNSNYISTSLFHNYLFLVEELTGNHEGAISYIDLELLEREEVKLLSFNGEIQNSYNDGYLVFFNDKGSGNCLLSIYGRKMQFINSINLTEKDLILQKVYSYPMHIVLLCKNIQTNQSILLIAPINGNEYVIKTFNGNIYEFDGQYLYITHDSNRLTIDEVYDLKKILNSPTNVGDGL